MKNSKTEISILNFSVLLLIVIMLFPTIFQFAHAFEDHKQSKCNEVTTHIHELEVECSICDFQISTFNYSFINEIDFLLTKNHTIYADYYKSKKHNSIKLSFSLRGPPLFS